MKFSFWQWLPIHRWRIVGMVESADEIPEKLPPKGAVLVGTKNYSKWLAFDCPCGGRHRIMLNMDQHRWPNWTIQSLKPMTINPSVDSWEKGQRCHYFIRKGRVQWVPNDLS